MKYYSSFTKPIVGIVSTHPSIFYPVRNMAFYQHLFKSLYDGGYSAYPEYDYVLLNGLEIKDVVYDLQLD